jgi:hypothetical protein
MKKLLLSKLNGPDTCPGTKVQNVLRTPDRSKLKFPFKSKSIDVMKQVHSFLLLLVIWLIIGLVQCWQGILKALVGNLVKDILLCTLLRDMHGSVVHSKK